ncbi:unnamed protein product [Trichobilharzia regenti]|nr:unnamed protein product [Trichobilharzia regenti]
MNIDLNIGDNSSSKLVNEFEDDDYAVWESQKQRRSLLLTENTNMVVQREQEINQIVRSIHELSEIFRDVAQMVVDQGFDRLVTGVTTEDKGQATDRLLRKLTDIYRFLCT